MDRETEMLGSMIPPLTPSPVFNRGVSPSEESIIDRGKDRVSELSHRSQTFNVADLRSLIKPSQVKKLKRGCQFLY